MWKRTCWFAVWIREFFRLGLGAFDLKELYTAMHMIRYSFNYSGETVDAMMPWEFQVELDMIQNSLQKEAAAKHG